MKLSDIFRKKSKTAKAEKAFVKIDKKLLSKITGGTEVYTKTFGDGHKTSQDPGSLL